MIKQNCKRQCWFPTDWHMTITTINTKQSTGRAFDNGHFFMDHPAPLTAVLDVFTLPTNADDHLSLQSNDEAERDFRYDRIFSQLDDADLRAYSSSARR
jgi:hypothetical protein